MLIEYSTCSTYIITKGHVRDILKGLNCFQMFVKIVLDKRVGNMERAGWSSRIFFFFKNERFLRMITANLIQRNDINIIAILVIYYNNQDPGTWVLKKASGFYETRNVKRFQYKRLLGSAICYKSYIGTFFTNVFQNKIFVPLNHYKVVMMIYFC